MLIDKFQDQWLDRLNVHADGAKDTSNTYLLIDGVFIPGFYRLVNAVLPSSDSLTLLFESLPACSDSTRAVSPFITPYATSNKRLQNLLRQCSGWPMVSAVETTESQSELTARLAAWCVVEADKSRFNLRFPDTRRLAGIYEVLTAKQQMELSGPATRWSYVDRYGSWADLKVMGTPSSMTDRPELDAEQFAQLVSASEVDEVISLLANRGYVNISRASHTYTAVSIALRSANVAGLDPRLKVDWCEACLARGLSVDELEIGMRLAQWRASGHQTEETSP
jgi:hypothetical protein